MQNAFLAGILVSIACGVIGTLVIVNKMTFIAGGIAHGAYGGIGIAILLSFSPILGAGIFSVILAIIVAFITLKNKERFDSIIGVIWAFGMAFGIILIDLKSGYNVDLMSYLFGSILTVSSDILIFILIADIIFISISIAFYRQFCAISFDSEFAKLRGVNVVGFYYLLVIMTAICIVSTIQVVGLLLVIALITIPSYIAENFCKSIGAMMFFSSILASIFCICGLFASYYLNLTSGASIIMVASITFFISILIQRVRNG